MKLSLPRTRAQKAFGPPRPLRVAAYALLGLWGLYLLVANLALLPGLIPGAVHRATPQVKLSWDRAYTLWPGHTNVSGFAMQLDDDGTVQIDLRAEQSSARLSLPALLDRRIRLEHVRARGVVYRMSAKVSAATAAASPARVAAFPVVDGFASPPLLPETPSRPFTPEELDRLWKVELNDIVSDMTELWFDEVRYVGPAHAEGSFALEPLKALRVGPALMLFQGGTLSAGAHVLASRFDATLAGTLRPVALSGVQPAALLAAVSASIHCDTRLHDLSIAELYLDDAALHGAGSLFIGVQVVDGKITRESTVKLTLERLAGRAAGFSFDGRSQLAVSVTDAGRVLAQATVDGELGTPPLVDEPLRVRIRDARAEATVSTRDLAATPRFERLWARVDDATVDDARPLVRTAGKYVPVIAPAVLGDGPLTATATATVTPEYALLRLEESKLGAANLSGALYHSSSRWNGAAAGHFDQLSLGLQVIDGVLHYHPFVGPGWLEGELNRIGLTLEAVKASPAW